MSLLSDHDLWKRLAQLPIGQYGAMLDLCQVSKMTGQKLRHRKDSVSEPVRERLSKGFALMDEGRIGFKLDHTLKRGRKKTIAFIIEQKPLVPTIPYFYPSQLVRDLKHDQKNLSLSPLPARMVPVGRR
jgi:hypothetical protein